MHGIDPIIALVYVPTSRRPSSHGLSHSPRVVASVTTADADVAKTQLHAALGELEDLHWTDVEGIQSTGVHRQSCYAQGIMPPDFWIITIGVSAFYRYTNRATLVTKIYVEEWADNSHVTVQRLHVGSTGSKLVLGFLTIVGGCCAGVTVTLYRSCLPPLVKGRPCRTTVPMDYIGSICGDQAGTCHDESLVECGSWLVLVGTFLDPLMVLVL